MEGRDNGENN